ncbi:hypothetical protein NEA10_17990 [Phormidium yuhuli AB48]|uniref:Uncharacterized protein n=1 Tax=Phormidium yuhuli AB48 TaxID=2940671 RepID=A0ABY5ANA9_9CYAN|nr:hypothetical protein [Phormidium yuhuli]USR90688.1 hypothetical protein NEA10_17990 [Phormidium yuhuli AB48]
MSSISPSATYSLEHVVERICALRQITPVDRHLLTHVLTNRSYFGRHEQNLVDRVYHGIHDGNIWIVDN